MNDFKHQVRSIDDLKKLVPVEPPWTIGVLLAWLSAEIGTPIKLVPLATPDQSRGWECTLTIRTVDCISIYYNATRSARHQRQQVCHEFWHIIRNHRGTKITDAVELGAAPPALQSSVNDPAILHDVYGQ